MLMNMSTRLALVLAAMIVAGTQPAAAQDKIVTVASWGGSFQDAQREAIIADLRERRKRLDVPEVAVPPLA